MKKILIALTLVCLVASPTFAMGIGARAMGMGGAYTALARDITAAYWNPAGLIKAGLLAGDGMLSGGYQGNVGYDQLTNMMDFEKFIEDEWTSEIDYFLTANGIIGGSARGIGISYIPWAYATLNKGAGSTTATDPTPSLNVDGMLKSSVAVTFGHSFGGLLPLASPLHIGANVRSVTANYWNLSHAGGPFPPDSAFVTEANGTGLGVDVGAQVDVTPLVTVGVVLKNPTKLLKFRIQ